MTRIRKVSGEDRTVSGLGGRLVLAGQVVELPNEDAPSYTCQTVNWVIAPTKKEK